MEVELRTGELGQFDVLVDGERVAWRESRGWRRMLGGGWPEAEEVIAKIRERQSGVRS